MQNQLDNGTVLYTEHIDSSGLVVREMTSGKNPHMRYQVGKYTRRPMRIPVYTENGVLTHHREGDDIQVLHVAGFGRTKREALDRASNVMIRAEIAATR